MAGYWGYVSQLGIGTTSTVDQRLDYLSESLACQEEFPDTGGLRGTRSHAVERVRAGIRRVAGTITLQPTAVELSYLLPWILGANASGTTYALADALQSRYVSVDRGAKVFLYDAVWVDSATFRATQGSPLSVTLNLVGSDETVNNAGTFPSLTLDTTTNAFMFHDCVLSIGGSAYSARDFELTINNHVDRERIFNAQVLSTATKAMDRNIMMRTSLPYGDATAAYATGSSGVAVTATFTNGAVSCLFSLVKVCFPRRSPTVPGRQEIMLPLEGVAYMSSSTRELVTTLDSTP
jgi:hypothetical protein